MNLNWLPGIKRWSKPRDIALDAVCCKGTIECRLRGINRQSHFALRFVPSRHEFIFYITLFVTMTKIPENDIIQVLCQIIKL